MRTRIVTLLVTAMMLLTVAGVAVANGAETAVEQKTAVVDELLLLLPSGIDKADDDIVDAAARLQAGLASELWTEGVPSSKDVFEQDAKAVESIQKALDELAKADHPVVSDALRDLAEAVVSIDRDLAGKAIADAAAAGGHVAKPQKKFDKAMTRMAEGDAEGAVKYFGKAWEYAGKAVITESGSSKGTEESYAEYTFWFVDVETGQVLDPITESNATGASGYTGKGNEGLMQVGSSVLSLHVSCSDAFPGGVGEKSNPAADSQLRVERFEITKYKYGEVYKTCGYENLYSGAPATPSTPDVMDKHAVYTFSFYNVDTGLSTGPITESNQVGEAGYTGKSNEGLMVVDGDTFQLHVSCSDAFPGGVGEKSDPAADSPWRVERYEITKYRDGVADKSCGFDGFSLAALSVEKNYRVDGFTAWLPGDVAGDIVTTADAISFQFIVTNTGNVDLTDVAVTDSMFAVEVAGNPDCSVPVLAPGASFSCELQSVYLAGGEHVNTAVATGASGAETPTAEDSVHLRVIEVTIN